LDKHRRNAATQNSVNRFIGIQLTIPLYDGGTTLSALRQSSASYERARAQLEAKTNKVNMDLKRAYLQTRSGLSKIDALSRAVASSRLSVKATEASIRGGFRATVDLLNAREQLSTSQRDLAQARYAYLNAVLRLRAAGSALGRAGVDRVGTCFDRTAL
jgi:protease secretion system outer membrane protein